MGVHVRVSGVIVELGTRPDEAEWFSLFLRVNLRGSQDTF
jgi:hypothetical protein